MFVSPLIRYGDIEGHTLGDLSETMRRLRQYQVKENPSTENKKRSSDKWFTIGSDTNGLPRWYYDAVYGDYETRQQNEAEWEEVLK